MRRKGFQRDIVEFDYYRTSSHPNGAADSCIVTLECGHEKRFKGSKVPKKRAWCNECLNEFQGGIIHMMERCGLKRVPEALDMPDGITREELSRKARRSNSRSISANIRQSGRPRRHPHGRCMSTNT